QNAGLHPMGNLNSSHIKGAFPRAGFAGIKKTGAKQKESKKPLPASPRQDNGFHGQRICSRRRHNVISGFLL
ncbi:TPA: hypothetical protein DDW35_01545, partial [Candidatus Sumerlaeota bacterium]|nr:hypothetical protein [Candidatus Sumerlaeota bacterium]